MKSFNQYIAEVFNTKIPLHYIEKTEKVHSAKFSVDGETYKVGAEKQPSGTWEIVFLMYTGADKTGVTFGKSNLGTAGAVQVFSAVMEFIREFIKEVQPDRIVFSADKPSIAYDPRGSSRESLYKKMVMKYTPSNYTVEIKDASRFQTYFILTKKQ